MCTKYTRSSHGSTKNSTKNKSLTICVGWGGIGYGVLDVFVYCVCLCQRDFRVIAISVNAATLDFSSAPRRLSISFSFSLPLRVCASVSSGLLLSTVLRLNSFLHACMCFRLYVRLFEHLSSRADLLSFSANFYYCTPPIIAPAMQMHRVPAMIEEFKKRGATLEVNIF